ncbi:agouti-related protein [Patagioenas fasciata]|uniref:Agouti-related protein-like n=1 Tax=Patagioenas fasciata monilis TaxID=372326 RepID=A0A1V4K0V6_PATFA|nr:agouti-related protein-like [Patagioenas fasciata monilis]
MLNVLLLCCGLLQGIQAILSADLSHSHLQKENGRLEGIDRAHYSSLLQKVKEMSAEPAGALPRLGFEPVAQEVQEVNGDFVRRASTLEPQATSAELQAEGREARAPRRCIRLLESCLGQQQVPCCDPCATCYCRFFNSVCYCRKLSTASSCGKN